MKININKNKKRFHSADSVEKKADSFFGGQKVSKTNRQAVNLRQNMPLRQTRPANLRKRPPQVRALGSPKQSGGGPAAQKPNSKNIWAWILEKVAYISMFVAIAGLPLFFLSNLPSALELAKQFFLVIVVGTGLLAWVGSMAWKNQIRFKKSFVLVPILTLLVVFSLSALLSVYPARNIWGFFGGEGFSLVTTIFLAGLFLLIINNAKKQEDIFFLSLMLVASSFITGLIGVLQAWDKFIFPSTVTQISSFNTVGSVYLLAVFLGGAFLLCLSLVLSKIPNAQRMVLVSLASFLFFVLVLINLDRVWVGLIGGIGIIFVMMVLRGKERENNLKVIPMIFLVLAVFLVLKNKPLIDMEFAPEILLSHKASLSVARDALKRDSLLGQGPAAYQMAFQKSRPDNLGQFWSASFNSGSTYFFTLAGSVGVLGIFAFLFLLLTGLGYFLRSILGMITGKVQLAEHYLLLGTGVCWLFVSVIFFFYLANTAVLFLWWVSFALFFALLSMEEKDQEFVTTRSRARSSLVISFGFILVIVAMVAMIYLSSQKIIAAAAFNKALAADKSQNATSQIAVDIEKAIDLDPDRDVYFRNLSLVYFALANERIKEKGENLSAEDNGFISQMVQRSLKAAQDALDLDQSNAENYSAVARVFEGSIGLVEEAPKKAIENYQRAAELDPRNPLPLHKIAQLYIILANAEISQAQKQAQPGGEVEVPDSAKQNLALARNALQQALQIKPDFFDASLLMTEIYEQEEDFEGAIRQESTNKTLMPNRPEVAFRLGFLYYKTDDFEKAQKELERAVILDSRYSNARYFLGLVYDAQGDNQKAIEQFEKVLEYNPGNEQIQEILDNLNRGRSALTSEAEFIPPPPPEPADDEEEPEDSSGEENGILEDPTEELTGEESEADEDEDEDEDDKKEEEEGEEEGVSEF